MKDWKNERLEGEVWKVQDWKGEGLSGCMIGRMYDWKSV